MAPTVDVPTVPNSPKTNPSPPTDSHEAGGPRIRSASLPSSIPMGRMVSVGRPHDAAVHPLAAALLAPASRPRAALAGRRPPHISPTTNGAAEGKSGPFMVDLKSPPPATPTPVRTPLVSAPKPTPPVSPSPPLMPPRNKVAAPIIVADFVSDHPASGTPAGRSRRFRGGDCGHSAYASHPPVAVATVAAMVTSATPATALGGRPTAAPSGACGPAPHQTGRDDMAGDDVGPLTPTSAVRGARPVLRSAAGPPSLDMERADGGDGVTE